MNDRFVRNLMELCCYYAEIERPLQPYETLMYQSACRLLQTHLSLMDKALREYTDGSNDTKGQGPGTPPRDAQTDGEG